MVRQKLNELIFKFLLHVKTSLNVENYHEPLKNFEFINEINIIAAIFKLFKKRNVHKIASTTTFKLK